MDWNRTYWLAIALSAAAVLFVLSRTRRGEAVAADVVEAVVTTFTPRGVSNNNPGNLRDFGIKWQGLADPSHDAQGYARFTDPLLGLRAAARDLLTKYRSGLRSVEAIFHKYAPPSENNTAAYVAAVSKRLNVAPKADARVPDRLVEVLRAVVAHENGAKWEHHYTAQQYAEAAKRALA